MSNKYYVKNKYPNTILICMYYNFSFIVNKISLDI